MTQDEAKKLAKEAIELVKDCEDDPEIIVMREVAQALLDSLEREEELRKECIEWAISASNWIEKEARLKAALECSKRQRDERLFGFNKDLFKKDDEELEQILKGGV